jgi:tetratricopeptide (TPR) repeat protein
MPETFEDSMERGEAVMSDRRHADALVAFEAALKAAKAPHQRAQALNRMANACYQLKEDKRAFDLLDEAIALCLPIADIDRLAALALARAWYDKGGMLAQLGKSEGLQALELLIDRFADKASADLERDDDELQLRYTVVLAMNLRAASLRKLDRKRDALACCDDMIRRFAPVTEGAIEKVVARVMLNRAWLAADLGRADEEIAGYDALVARYGENHLLSVSHTIIDALTGKHQCYRDQEEYEKAIEACDEIIRRYQFDPGEDIAERVARTMIRRANYLNKLGRSDEEFAAYDQVSQMFGHFEEREVRLHAAKALMFKAVSLNDADQSAAEMECYEEVLHRFAEDRDDEVRAVAADALIHKGMSLGVIAEDAAEDTGVREIEAEIACYDEVVARYGEEQPIVLRRAVAEALLHKAETLLEAGRTRDGSANLELLLSRYAAIEDEEIQDTVKEARALKAEI